MSKQLLANEIMRALSFDKEADPEVAKRTAANAIANAIDSYVQQQIGLRLSQISSAILVPCPTPAGPIPTPPIPGPNFTQFTKLT